MLLMFCLRRLSFLKPPLHRRAVRRPRSAGRATALGLLLLSLNGPAVAVLTIEITGGAEGASPVAVLPFGWEADGVAPEDIGRIIADNLRRSGRFAPLARENLIARPTRGDEVRFADWRVLGADHLVVGRVLGGADGAYQVQFQLFDVLRSRQIAGYSIPARAGQLRRVAHRISDLIYQALTGESGAFDTRIAYVTKARAADGTSYQLKVADADGYGEQTVLKSAEPIMSPAWSPDGRQIAYVSFEHKRAEIWLQTLADGQRRRIAALPGINGAPAWSPDGRELLLTLSQDGNPEIYRLALADGRFVRLTQHPAIDTEAVFSADGKSIYFTSDRGGRPQIYRMAREGGRAERVTFEGSYNASPTPSPNGRMLGLIHQDQAGYHVAVLDLQDGLLTVLSDGQLDESPSFAPNGAMLIYATEAGGRGALAVSSVDGRVGQRLRLSRGDVREPAWSPLRESE